MDFFMKRKLSLPLTVVFPAIILSFVAVVFALEPGRAFLNMFDHANEAADAAKIEEGRQTFRFDTFGDEAFWGDALHLHRAIEGTKFGGVGPGVSPAIALALGK